jgi:hypothetical protein
MTQIGTLSLNGIFHEDAQYPFYLESSIVKADEGKAVALDSASANTVKLAGDDDVIIGRLEFVEIREVEGVNVGTVAMAGGYKFPIDDGLAAGDVPDVGEYLSGASEAGTVKGSTTASRWLVVEVASDDSYAIAIAV